MIRKSMDRMFADKDVHRILCLIGTASAIGIWAITHTNTLTRDGVYWTECAQRIESTESLSGTFGMSGQRYLFRPEKQGGTHMPGNSGVGISVGTNGISVLEYDTRDVPALAVYAGNLGTGWNQVTVTYTHKQPRIYVNGIRVHTGLPSPKKNVVAPKQLGGLSWGYFKGAVKSVCIWKRPLSDSEVLAGVTGDSASEGLVGWWRFDEGAGATAHDSSANQFHAAIRGGTWIAHGKDHAIEFDGVDDIVWLNCKPPRNNFTVSAWVRTDADHEIPSTITNLSRTETPAFLLTIAGWHRLLNCFGLGEENLDWAVAGQTLCLLCRILALVPLYYLGKLLLGGHHAFLALLILIFLPWPAEWGHDVLREWPHLLFLSGSLLMVLLAFTYQRAVYCLPAGLLAGFGYLIRFECIQVLAYALCGLVFVLLRPSESMTRKKALLGVLLLMAGFSVFFIPNVQLKGEILPSRLQGLAANGLSTLTSDIPTPVQNSSGVQHALFASSSTEGIAEILQILSENLYYYFFPFMLVGLYVFSKHQQQPSPGKWFIGGFMVLNIVICMALYHQSGYISRRHLLPLTAITTLFIPLGIEAVVGLLSRRRIDLESHPNRKKQVRICGVLTVVGLLTCLPKLIEPMGRDDFRRTAEYLQQNTPINAIVSVPDRRIPFYAGRSGILYETPPTNGMWDYLVTIEERPSAGHPRQTSSRLNRVYSLPLSESGDRLREVVVYRQVWREE